MSRLAAQDEALAVIALDLPTFDSGKRLGIQRLKNSSRNTQVKSSFELLKILSLTRNTNALVFDKTPVNSG